MNNYVSKDSKLDKNFASEVLELCFDERYEAGKGYDFSVELFNFLMGERAIRVYNMKKQDRKQKPHQQARRDKQRQKWA